MHPDVRQNTDVAITFGHERGADKEALAEEYFGSFPKSDVFRVLHSYCGREPDSESRHFIGVNCRNLEGKPLPERIYQGHAEETPPFVMGCKEWCILSVCSVYQPTRAQVGG